MLRRSLARCALRMTSFPLSASPMRRDPRPPTCASIGADLASQLSAVSRDNPDVKRTILEHVRENVGEEAWPAPTKTEYCASLLLASLKTYVEGPLAMPASSKGSGGTRMIEAQQALDTVAAAVHSEKVADEKLVSTALTLTGLSRRMWNKGGGLRNSNEEAVGSGGAVAVGVSRMMRSDAVDLDFLFDYFHSDKCPDVEPDKSTKFQYKRKRVFVAGKWRNITCKPRILTCSVAEATENAMNSDVYRQSGVTLHSKTVASCICWCTKPAKRAECTCPICNEFVEALTAYHRSRHHWHAADDAQCKNECGLGCKDKTSEFRTFTRNYAEFESAIRCPKVAFPELALPHDPNQPPAFFKLACCLKRKRRQDGTPTGEHLPDGAVPCARCKPKRDRLMPPTPELRCKDESNQKPAKWMKYKDIDIGDGKTSNKLVEHHGTRAELMAQIERQAQEWSFHRWVKNWMKHQSKLNVATFDGESEIVVLTDYAAVYEMKGKTSRYVATRARTTATRASLSGGVVSQHVRARHHVQSASCACPAFAGANGDGGGTRAPGAMRLLALLDQSKRKRRATRHGDARDRGVL